MCAKPLRYFYIYIHAKKSKNLGEYKNVIFLSKNEYFFNFFKISGQEIIQ